MAVKRGAVLLALAAAGLCCAGRPAQGAALPLHVVYVGNSKSPRAADYEAFLKKHFKRVSVADRERFDPATAKAADVVLLDWSQSETDVRKAKSPFGNLEDWHRPTVLLGSAGLLLAGQWQLIGGAG
jgi:hypothetical protein